MQTFAAIRQLAEKKHGRAALDKNIADHKSKPKAQLRKIGDDRWLSQLTKCVFNAGFNWKVIEAKWPGFETAFEGFEPRRWAMMSDKDLDRLLKDTHIVRNAQKILSVRDNAIFLKDLAAEHASAAKVFADWPDTDYVGLLEMMAKRGSRLGGGTATYALRFMGKPSFILSQDVTAALIRAGVVDKAPSGKGALRTVQAAFNQWAEESGKDLTEISRTLAMSV